MFALTAEEEHYEKYLDVALELLTQTDGPNPSSRALVERLGGSLTTANKAMRVFWGYVARRLSYDQQYPEGMPLDVIKMMEQLMASARLAAQKELDDQKAQLKERESSADERVAEIALRLKQLTHLHDEQKATISKLSVEIEEKSEINSALKDKLQQLESAHTEVAQALQKEQGNNNLLSDQLSQVKSVNEKLYQEVEALTKRVEEKTSRLIELERHNAELAQKVLHEERLNSQRQQVSEAQQKAIDQLEQSERELIERLNMKSVEYAKIKAVHDKQTTMLDRLSVDNRAFQDKLLQTENRMLELSDKHQKLLMDSAKQTGIGAELVEIKKERDGLVTLLSSLVYFQLS